MKLRKLFSVLLVLCLMLVLLPTEVDAAEVIASGTGQFTWKLTDAGTLTISDTIAGRVTSTSYSESKYPWYQYRNQITKVVITGEMSFVPGCGFRGYTKLKSVSLSDDIEAIDPAAFARCTALETVKIPAGVTVIDDSAFSGCTALNKVTFVSASSLERIGESAFYGSGLESVSIPASVRKIENYAFKGCEALTSVTLRDGIETIGFEAFADCPALTGKLYLSKTITNIALTAFDGAKGITSLTVNTAASIGDAFSESTALTSVTFGGDAFRVPNGAFENCTALSEVILGEKMTTIGTYAFSGCSALTEIAFPDSMETIDMDAFKESGLQSVVIPDSVTEVDIDAFVNCKELVTLQVGKGLTELGGFEGCEKLTTVSMGNVEVLLYGAFQNCSSLTTIHWSDELEEIQSKAFQNCTALRSVELPSSVDRISYEVFAGCTSLSEITFRGDVPAFDSAGTTFEGVTATAYYPANYGSWVPDVMQDYGGTLTWVGYEKSLEAPEVTGSNVASSGKVKLTWEKVDGAFQYRVYRSTSKTGTYKLMKTTTGTSYTNTSATAGTTYYYYVIASDAYGTLSPQSNIVTRTCDLVRPVVSVSNVAKTGKIKLTWKAVEGAVSYKVYRSDMKYGTYKLMKTTTSTSYVNTSAAAGHSYYYKVVAVGEKTAANSAYSSVKYRMCDLPRPAVSIALKNGKPRLSWKTIDGAVKYKVYRATSEDGTYELLNTIKSTAFTNTSAKAGVTYYYKVVAVHTSKDANSAYSLVDSIKSK